MDSKVCLTCKKSFKKNNYDSWKYFREKKKYCSWNCWQVVWKRDVFPKICTDIKVIFNCLICDKEFKDYTSNNRKFCSRICKGIWHKENKSMEQHWNWQGGLTEMRLQIRHSYEYKQWRLAIFKRDDFTCQICGSTEAGNLQVDHWPKPFALIIKENNIHSLEGAFNCEALWDINNNRTLCVDCHKQTDTYLSKYRMWLKETYY